MKAWELYGHTQVQLAMSLGVCPDCERKISLRADSCPHCGCPNPFEEKPSPPSFWSSKLPKLFGIDLRSLALFRVAIALVLLYDLAGRVVDVRAFYSDEGIVTVAQQQNVCLPWVWSLNFLNGSVGFQTAIFVVAFIFATSLLVGFATRWATVGCWVLAVSIHVRGSNSLVNGGDILLTSMLFWAMFLPLGRQWSLDSALWRGKSATREPVVSIASAAILIQVFFMYFFTGIWKTNDLWYSGQALEKALSYDLYVKPLGGYLLNYAGLLKFLTYGMLILELVGPFLLFSPWKTVHFRIVLWAVFMSLHIGIEMTMTVELFSFMSMAALTLFLPVQFWNWILRRKGKGPDETLLQAVNINEEHISQCTEKESQEAGEKEKAQDGVLTRLYENYGGILIRLRNGFVGFMLVFVLLWNINSVFRVISRHTGQSRSVFGSGANQVMLRFANLTSMNQVWFMFDEPSGIDTWYVAEAQLRDGSQVDVLKAGAPINENKPDRLYASFRNHRWKMIFTRLSPQGMFTGYGAVYRDGLVDYLRREWDEQHESDRQIVVLNLLRYTEIRPPGIDEYPVTMASSGKIGSGNYFRNGMRQGFWALRDEHGNKAEGNYADGMRQGLWTQWYPDGHKSSEGTFINDLENGHFIHWAPDGRKIREGPYRHGVYYGE